MTHVALDLTIDFDARVVRGSATIDLAVAAGAREVILDTRRLAIHAVRDEAGGALAHSLGKGSELLGAPLTIELPSGTSRVCIDYETSPDAEALQWLGAEQTAGGSEPFLFTQGHAIQTRSWIPLQDSPGIRLTYEARVRVRAPLTALMSAERTSSAQSAEHTVFGFVMREPIPAYLIALAVGRLASQEIGPRTAVFAEPETLASAAAEFSELEVILDAAEALVGPYRWGRFDVLVMPPSFPYGGMENPRLTFASPTLLAGDRSLVTVIVHELAHAWAGNLVVNATWNDFWLNEGTTVYLELRLNEALWGRDRSELLQSWSWRELSSEIERSGATPDTRLRYDMNDRDPAEGVTVIPYLKGAAFFWTLEAAVGRERLDAALRSWFEVHSFHSVTTDMLLAHLRTELSDLREFSEIDLDAWVDAPGTPVATAPRSAVLERVDAAAAAALDGAAADSLDVRGFTPAAWRQFLTSLRSGEPDAALLTRLDGAFGFGASSNAEVVAPWLRLLVKARVESAAPALEAFLRAHGRAKYLRPLVQDMLASDWAGPLARRVYAAQRARYHVLVRGSLDRLFNA